jgi:branched-chain amino acid transport system permease protein
MEKMKSWMENHKKLLIVLGIIVLCILPQLSQSNYIRGVLARIIIYATIASGLNVINGYSGQSCLGIVGFTCIGAYCSGILSTRVGLPFIACLFITLLFCIAAGYLVSLPTLKLNGMFLSIITLGFSEMMRLLALNWQGLTYGPIGLKGIPNIVIFGFKIKSGAPFYYLALVVLLIVVFILHRLLNSRVGRAWISIREDQDAARSLGIDVAHYRCINFMTGAAICGTMGVFIAYYYRYLHPDMFSLDEGFSVLSMCIIGGSGTLLGPIVGAFVINAFTEGFRFASDWRMVMYALLIIVMMWVRPQGLFGAKDSVIAGRSSIRLPGFLKKNLKSQEKGGSN